MNLSRYKEWSLRTKEYLIRAAASGDNARMAVDNNMPEVAYVFARMAGHFAVLVLHDNGGHVPTVRSYER
jgi:hypothetical protein